MTTITIDRAVVQQALEALENCSSEYGHRCNRCDSEVDEGGKVASALRAALAQQQAEPVQRLAAVEAGRNALLQALERLLPAYRKAVKLYDPNTDDDLTVAAHNAIAIAKVGGGNG